MHSRVLLTFQHRAGVSPYTSTSTFSHGPVFLINSRFPLSSATTTRCPAIYEANGFEIVSGNLDGYYWVQDKDDYIIITHKLIFEAGTNTFWEVYFDNPTSNESTLLENVVKDLSFREGIPAPTLEHNKSCTISPRTPSWSCSSSSAWA